MKLRHNQALINTLRSMGPAVGTALVVTILGFVALFLSPVPMVVDFGKMLAIGVSISFAAATLLLLPILYIRDRFFPLTHNNPKYSEAQDSLSRFLGKTTEFVIKRGSVLIAIALVITGLGIWADGKVGVQTDVEKFMPQNTQALQDVHSLRQVLGSTDQIVLSIQGDNLMSPSSLRWIDQLTEGVKSQFPAVVTDSQSITSIMRLVNGEKIASSEKEVDDFLSSIPVAQRKLFVSADNAEMVIQVNIKHLEVSELNQFLEKLKAYVGQSPNGITFSITGKAVVDVAMISALTSGRQEMTLAGMVLVFLGLLVIYRHPVKAFIPLLPIALIIGWSGGTMYLLKISYTPLTATMGALIIGIGTEFTVLLMERYFEERKLGCSEKEAMLVAVQQIGKAVVASGLTVMGGFSALLISNFVILRDFGFLTFISMVFCLVSTLIILPPLITMLDRLFKLSRNRRVDVTEATA